MAMSTSDLEVFTTEKLDGIIIASSSWRFLNPRVNFRFDNNILVTKVENGTFKGIEGFNSKKQKMYSIFLGNCMEMELYQVLIVPQSMKTNYHYVLQAVKNAVNYAVQKMPDSNTFKDWKHRTPMQFQITCSGTGGARTIYRDDMDQFGAGFYHHLCDRFNTLFLGGLYSTKTVLKSLGQNGDWRTGVDGLSNIHFQHVNQLILHYAIDFERPRYALFWNKKKLIKKGFPKKPKAEYYPGLLHQNGNFYFDIDAEHKNSYRIVEIKTYSYLFRDMHKSAATPFFVKDDISRDLLYHRTDENSLGNKQISPWQQHINKIQMADRVITEIEENVKARIEAIVSFRNLTSQNSLNIAIIRFMRRPLLDKWSLYMCTNDIKVADLSLFLKKNVLPFVNTLKFYLQNRVLGIFDLKDYYNAKACEAVLCCTFYGDATFRKFVLNYDYKWLKKLEITKSHFRRGQIFSFSPTAGCILDRARQIVWFTPPNILNFPIPTIKLYSIVHESLVEVHQYLTKGLISERDLDNLTSIIITYLQIETMDIAKPPKRGKYYNFGDYNHAYVTSKAKQYPLKKVLSSREIAIALTSFPVPEQTEYILDYNSLVKVLCNMIVYGLDLLDKAAPTTVWDSMTSNVTKFRETLGNKIEKQMVENGTEFIILKKNVDSATDIERGENSRGVAHVGLPWCGIKWMQMPETIQTQIIKAFQYWSRPQNYEFEELSKKTLEYGLSQTQASHHQYDMAFIVSQLYDYEYQFLRPDFLVG